MRRRGMGVLEPWDLNASLHYSITPMLGLLQLIKFDSILLAHPIPDETLGIRVNLEGLLDGFFEPIAAHERIAA